MKFLITAFFLLCLKLSASDYLYLTTVTEAGVNTNPIHGKTPVWFFERMDTQELLMATACKKHDRLEKYAEIFSIMNDSKMGQISFWKRNRISNLDPAVFFSRQKSAREISIMIWLVPSSQTKEFEKILQTYAKNVIGSFSKQKGADTEYLLICQEKMPSQIEIGKMMQSYEVIFRKDLSEPFKVKNQQKKITLSPSLQPTQIFPRT